MNKDNKFIRLTDHVDIQDTVTPGKTIVKIYDHETGELIFTTHNKVIFPGAAFTLMKHYNINANVRTPSYNSVLSLENTDDALYEEPGIRREEQVVLFAVGVDGCGEQQHEIYPVDYRKWILPEKLVPFRFPLEINDLGSPLRQIYYGRKVIDNRVAYYFKAFDAEPKVIQQYKDGTPVDENLYESTKEDEVETYVELQLSVTKTDCREWFENTVGINKAKVNTFSLLTAWPKVVDGYVYYQDIRPLTKINISNEPLVDPSKGIDIVYQTFY